MLLGLLLALGTACGLLQPGEIAAVQGDAPRSSTPSESSDGALHIRRCFFALAKFDESVSLEVRSGTPAQVLAAWKRIESKEERENEGEEHEGRAQEIEGVGLEALWVGDGRSGALWVRGQAAIVRVSVGGGAKASAKVRSCRQLAKRVLRKLAKE